MLWSPQQGRALSTVAKWIKSRNQQVCRLFGYAGVGKTTLAQHFAEGVNGQVLFSAYTGKAALVLRNKGCRDASTIPRLIYRAEDGFICPNHPDDMYGTNTDGCRRCDSPLVRRPRFTLNRDSALRSASLLIIDESSMVNESLGRDLMSFGKPILVLGDPFQLPPPEGCGFFTAAEPDIMLTEVHRQARDSPIIAMSMTVREGGRCRYGESRVVAACDLEDADADQILVGLNARRRLVNATRREELGLTDPSPMAGDRLVCLRNDRVMGLLNGSLWDVKSVFRDVDTIRMQIEPDDGDGEGIEVTTHASFFNELRSYDAFDYGYALTVHRAQGSQWGVVLLVDESARFRENRARWLYTGITRAAERWDRPDERMAVEMAVPISRIGAAGGA